MVLLRSGLRTRPRMPLIRYNMDYHPCHYGMLTVRRNPQEMKALGLLVDDELTDEAEIILEEPFPPRDLRTPFYDPPTRPGFCTEILWSDNENPRACKNKASRGSNTCWRHAPNRRSAATAARQARTAARLQQRREMQHRRQQTERLLMRNARRFGAGPEPDPELAEDSQFKVRLNVDQTHPDAWRGDVEESCRRTLTQPNNVRRPLLDNPASAYLDFISDEQQVENGAHQETRDRCYDVGFVKADGGPIRAMFMKCSLCKRFEYPFETYIVPELRVIECIQCGCWVHRHCQVTVPPFYHDRVYRCPACIDGV